MSKTTKGIALGAVLGSLIGTFSVLLSPKRQKLLAMLQDQTGSWANKAKNIGRSARGTFDGVHWGHSHEVATTNFIKGSFMGLVVGAGAAMLLTPKTGSQVRKKITERYADVADVAQELIHVFNFGHKNSPVKKATNYVKKASTSIKKKAKRALPKNKLTTTEQASQ
jgi:gas vesicle protein